MKRSLSKYSGASVAMLLLAVHPAVAQIQIPACEIRVQDLGRLSNGSTSDADLSVSDPDGRVRLGRNVTFADGTSVSGAFVNLGNGSSIFNVNVDILHEGRGAEVRGTQGVFQGDSASCAFPAVPCGGANVLRHRGDPPMTLPPGTYNLLDLENGTSVTLSGGEYSFCQIKAGRHVSIEVAGSGQSTITVAGNVRLSNDSHIQPVAGTPTPLLNVGGDTVHIAAEDTVRAFVTAPDARLSIGRGATFTGAACAHTLAGSRNVTLECAPDVPVTTTTTSSTSSTSAPASSTTSSSTSSTVTPTSSSTSSTEESTTTTSEASTTTSEASSTTVSTTSSTTGGTSSTTTSTTSTPSTTEAPTTTVAPTTTTSTTEAPTTTIVPTTTTSTTEESTTTTSSTTSTTVASPTILDFVLSQPGGTCGSTQDASSVVIKNLTCGGLNIGGGGSIVPEGPTPDGSQSRFSLSCTGSSCNIGPTSTAPALNSADPDCTDVGCNFGTPLPIPNPTIPGITTCVMNTWAVAATGTLDLSNGTSSTNVPLNSDIYLTGNVDQPCPVCSGTGTPSNPGTGTCDRGPRAGMACTSTSSTGTTRDCPTGGSAATGCGATGTDPCPCTPGGGACIDGSHVGVISVNLSPLTTGTATATNPTGQFCPGQQTGSHAGCFGSTACRTITENGQAAGPVTPGTPASGTLASVFCIAATGNGLVDASADLPGPGAVSLPGTFVAHN